MSHGSSRFETVSSQEKENNNGSCLRDIVGTKREVGFQALFEDFDDTKQASLLRYYLHSYTSRAAWSPAGKD